MNSLKVWLHALLATAISSFATAASGALLLPTVFTFDKNGLINMIKMATVPTMLAVFLYLKQSPVPSLTVSAPANIEVDSGTVSVSGKPAATVSVQEKKP